MLLHKTLVWGVSTLALSTCVLADSGSAAKPAQPTQLQTKAVSTSEVDLTWSDNATNESEYHLEWRTATGGWTDMGQLPPNATWLRVFGLQPSQTYFFRVRAKNNSGYSPYSNEAAGTTYYPTPPSCATSDSTFCLGGRYLVQATYDGSTSGRAGVHGVAHTAPLSQESGLFWFFSADNVEALIKLLDGCALNQHHWIYASGLTDLRVLLLVIDTQTGATATYLSPGGAAFPAVTDTEALPCS